MDGRDAKHFWPMVPIGEIAKPIARPVVVEPGREYRTIGVRWWGEGAYERETIDGSRTAAKSLSLVCRDDLIINKIWVRHGSTAIATEAVDGCAASGEFPTFELDRSRVEPRWIHWQTKTRPFWNKCDGLSRGTSGKNRIKPELFLTITIPLPPIEEQRRIVGRIEALAEKIAEERGVLTEAHAAAEAMQSALMRVMRAESLNRWPSKKLGDIARVTAGGTPSRENPTYWNGDIPWIKTGELLDGDITHAEEHITTDGVANSSAKVFPPGTVLIALYGQGQTRGRTGRLMIHASTNQACASILPTPQALESRFTQYWLRSLYSEMREDNHGGAQPNWNGQMIKDINIAMPPLEEQRRIVAYLDSLSAKAESLKSLQYQSATELDALLPSILDRAFRGEL